MLPNAFCTLEIFDRKVREEKKMTMCVCWVSVVNSAPVLGVTGEQGTGLWAAYAYGQVWCVTVGPKGRESSGFSAHKSDRRRSVTRKHVWVALGAV